MHKILIASDGAGMINWCTDALCLLVIYLKIYGFIQILMYMSTFNHSVTSKNKETTYWLSSRAIKAKALSWFDCGSVNISHERKYHSWGEEWYVRINHVNQSQLMNSFTRVYLRKRRYTDAQSIQWSRHHVMFKGKCTSVELR